MKINKYFVLPILLTLAHANGASRAFADSSRNRRDLEVIETIRMNLPTGAGAVKLWIPKLANTSHQKARLVELESSWAHRVTKDPEYGNEIIFLESQSPTAGPVEFNLRYVVSRREQRHSLTEGEVSPWDKEPRGLTTVTDEIRKIARETTTGVEDPLEKARALYHYVFSRMEYDKTGEGWGRGDTVYACKTRKGNCTDFHSLFAALAMSEGIPARFRIGFSLPPASEGELGSGYHCWAEFHVRGKGWIPVDISEAWKKPSRAYYYFGNLDKDRVLVSTGREIQLSPRQNGEPLNYMVRPYAEVDGKPLGGLEISRRYKNLSARKPT